MRGFEDFAAPYNVELRAFSMDGDSVAGWHFSHWGISMAWRKELINIKLVF